MTPQTADSSPSEDKELSSMIVVTEALNRLNEEERSRVIDYVLTRFKQPAQGQVRTPAQSALTNQPVAVIRGTEIEGIACLDDMDNIKLTVRDLKAKSTQDAAIRIAHIVIYASEELLATRAVSSRKSVVPMLREYRAYDSNARTALARHKGIIRNGDMLSLDAHSRREAEQYIREILNDAVEGKWHPKAVAKKRPVRKSVGGGE